MNIFPRRNPPTKPAASATTASEVAQVDLVECPSCLASGRIKGSRCERCHGFGSFSFVTYKDGRHVERQL